MDNHGRYLGGGSKAPPFSQDWCHQAFKNDHNTPDCPTDNASMSLITGARRVLAPWIALEKRFRFRTTIGIGIVTVIILVFRAQEGIGRLVVLNLLRSPRLLAQLLLFDHKNAPSNYPHFDGTRFAGASGPTTGSNHRDLFDHDLLPLLEHRILTSARRAYAAMFHRAITHTAPIAACHRRNILDDKLGAAQQVVFVGCPAPRMLQVTRHHTRDLAELERHALHRAHLGTTYRFLYVADDIEHDS